MELPNILAYITGIFDDFFRAGLVPLRTGELKFWTPVNFEVKYFLNEETEGILNDTVIYFYDQHLTWLSLLKPNAKVRGGELGVLRVLEHPLNMEVHPLTAKSTPSK